ncbi:MAG: alpha/beta hydrolase [Actinobacteria bacterium]|nr:alpha/beta hydrolase [Actinomycetota bacterium]
MPAVILPNSDAWVIDSAHTGARYRVTLSLPLLPTDAPVPLLVVLDGDTMFFSATEFIRTTNVVTMGTMPSMAVVGVTREEPDHLAYFSSRFSDFTPTEWRLHGPFEADNGMVRHGTGGADAFLAVLTDQLLPSVGERVQVDTDAVGICGWSLSGLFAAYAWRRRPDAFSRLLAISPSLWWGDEVLLAQPVSARPPGHRAVVCAGSREEGDIDLVWPVMFADGPQREMAAMVRNAERFGAMCAESGAATLTFVADHEHHVTMQSAALARGLVHLFAGR